MQFAKPLRDRVMRGEITCSVRIWQRPRVKVGGRYPLGQGKVHVTSVREIVADDVTSALARRSGFADVAALMALAKHGSGETFYLIEFDYED